MRLLHTSDWHLGHTLHEVDRTAEHRAFLDWLAGTIAERDVDALLVTGDVFDSANPPAGAQKLWYRFLVEARGLRKGLQIVAIAGNHDSAARLEAPREVLSHLNVHVVGELPREDGKLDAAKLLVPLKDEGGRTRAWVAAVPYLRPADLAGVDGGDDEAFGVDPDAGRIASVYAEAAALARSRRQDGEAIVVTGHLYAAGGNLSEKSERKIQKGNLEAVPQSTFDEDAAYVALGHLHLAQTVGGREHVRYAGSPIPLSLDEAGYRHQVVLVELDGETAKSIEAIPVPRTVPILRLPAEGPARLADVLARLGDLPPDTGRREPDLRPYLEVRLLVEAMEPGWKGAIEEAVDGKDVRLLRIDRTAAASGAPPGSPERSLGEVTPEEVFRMKYGRVHGSEPPVELLAAFAELVAEAEAER